MCTQFQTWSTGHTARFKDIYTKISGHPIQWRMLLTLLLLTIVSGPVKAYNDLTVQQKADSLRQKVDSMITLKYRDASRFDTLYIRRPATDWTFKVRTNLSGSSINMGSIKDLHNNHGRVEKDLKGSLAFAAVYKGLGLGIAFNPVKIFSHSQYTDFEINVASYGNKFGFEVAYSKANNYSGNIRIDGQDYPIHRKSGKLSTYNVNTYYAFNGRKFSFPAAFSQSYIQLRSAGSWLVGLSIMGAKVKLADTGVPGAENIRAWLGNISIGGGYGYNLVTHHHWLFHLSTLPTLVIVNKNNYKAEDGEKIFSPYKFPDFILTERAAVVHDFSSQWFVSVTGVLTNSIFGKPDKFFMGFNRWRVRIAVGYRI
jgi:hypothetical protein